MFKNLSYSLADMLGKEYVDRVIEANCFFDPEKEEELKACAYEKVPFYPEEDQKKNDALLSKVGTQVASSFNNDNVGAPTDSYKKAFNKNAAPLTGHGHHPWKEQSRNQKPHH